MLDVNHNGQSPNMDYAGPVIPVHGEFRVPIAELRISLAEQEEDHVNSCAFSFDWIVTASDDTTVRVWSRKRKIEAVLWECTKTLKHDSPVKSCIFSSDYCTLYTVTRASSIVAWKVPPADDKNRYEKEYQIVANQKLRLEASTSELQRKLARINEELKMAKAYAAERLRSERQRCRFQLAMTHKIYAEEALPRAHALEALLSAWRESVRDPWSIILRIDPGHQGPGHFAAVEGACLSPNGRWLATTSQDCSVVVWELSGAEGTILAADSEGAGGDDSDTGEHRGSGNLKAGGRAVKLLGHTDTVRAAAFNCASDQLCTVSYDGTARIWALDSDGGEAGPGAGPPWREVTILLGHAAAATGCSFSPSGTLATVAKDGTVCIHSADPAAANSYESAPVAGAAAAAASPAAGFRFASGNGSRLSVMSAAQSLWLADNSDSDEGGVLGNSLEDGPSTTRRTVSRARVLYEGGSLREGFFRSWDDLTRRQQDELTAAAADHDEKWANAEEARASNSPSPDIIAVKRLMQNGGEVHRSEAGLPASPLGAVVVDGGGKGGRQTSSGRRELRTAAIVHGRRAPRPDSRLSTGGGSGGPGSGPTLSQVSRWAAKSPPPTTAAMSQSHCGEEAWRVVTRFAAHGRAVYACTFAQEGQLLATASTDGEVRLWAAQGWTLWLALRTTAPAPPIPPSATVPANVAGLTNNLCSCGDGPRGDGPRGGGGEVSPFRLPPPNSAAASDRLRLKGTHTQMSVGGGGGVGGGNRGGIELGGGCGVGGHASTSGAMSVAASPDGRWLSACLWNGRVVVWDISRDADAAAPPPESRVVPVKVFRSAKYRSPGYTRPVIELSRRNRPTAGTSKRETSPEGTKGRSTGRRSPSPTRAESPSGNPFAKIVDGKLSFLQVTRTFHQEQMPFSAQCYGFAGVHSRRAEHGAAAMQAPVRSEEIGADWGDVFQRLQVVPLKYNVPQVSPRFRRFFEPYVPFAPPEIVDDIPPPDLINRRISASRAVNHLLGRGSFRGSATIAEFVSERT